MSTTGPRLVLTRIASRCIFAKRWAFIKCRVSGVTARAEIPHASRPVVRRAARADTVPAGGLRAVVGDHFAAKAVGDTSDYTTDLPKADDPEGTPV